MVMQIRRTIVAYKIPDDLEEGQLAVDMATTPPRMYVGVPEDLDPSEYKWINPNTLSADQITLVGVTNGSEAPSGQIGEILTAVGSTSVASIASGNAAQLTGSLNLPAGDWQIQGSVMLTHQGGGSSSAFTVGFLHYLQGGIYTAHPLLDNPDYYSAWVGTISNGQALTIPLPVMRWLSNQPYVVSLGYYHSMNAGSGDARVRMQALRVR